MEFKDGNISYDTLASAYSSQFMDSYSGKNYEKAILFLDSIELMGKKDHRTIYNKAICYKYLNQDSNCERYIREYLQYPLEKIKMGYVTQSILKDCYQGKIDLNRRVDSLINLKYKDVSDPDLALIIECLDAKEQEILMDSAYMNNRKMEDRYARLEANFNIIYPSIKKNKSLPSFKTVGQSLYFFELMVLHMDYNPKLQLKLGKKILASSLKNGNDVGRTLYCIDRALRNLNRKQKYGSIILNRGQSDSEIYKYKGSLKMLNRRRFKYGLVPIEEEKSTYQINKPLK